VLDPRLRHVEHDDTGAPRIAAVADQVDSEVLEPGSRQDPGRVPERTRALRRPPVRHVEARRDRDLVSADAHDRDGLRLRAVADAAADIPAVRVPALPAAGVGVSWALGADEDVPGLG